MKSADGRARCTSATGAARAALSPLLELTARALEARACFLRWDSAQGRDIAVAPPSAAQLGRLAIALLDSPAMASAGGNSTGRVIRFSGDELARLSDSERDEIPALAFASRAHQGALAVEALALLDRETAAERIGEQLPLLTRAGLVVLAACEEEKSREFWRARADRARARERTSAAALASERRWSEWLERAVTRAARLKPAAREAGLGSIVASAGPFNAWIVAQRRGATLAVAAAAPGVKRLPTLDERSALADSAMRQAVIIRPLPHSGIYREDTVFGCDYLCVPFEAGAIALISRGAIEDDTRARVEAVMTRLAPTISTWSLEEENKRLRALNADLAARMLGAADSERLRIARDLHDDQAQLLAAAKLALTGRKDEARGIFSRLESELRERVRELRPATLEGRTLRAAIAAELARLKQVGIAARVHHRVGVARLSRATQQICYQAVREAVSNVLRHSGATRVEVAIEHARDRARLTVSDNGGGLAAQARPAGLGLKGVGERVAMIGGVLRIESGHDGTRLIVEVPERA